MNISEKTVKTALVNYICVGKFGKCLNGFSVSDKARVVDIMERYGWISPDPTKIDVTPAGHKVVRENLHLLQY